MCRVLASAMAGSENEKPAGQSTFTARRRKRPNRRVLPWEGRTASRFCVKCRGLGGRETTKKRGRRTASAEGAKRSTVYGEMWLYHSCVGQDSCLLQHRHRTHCQRRPVTKRRPGVHHGGRRLPTRAKHANPLSIVNSVCPKRLFGLVVFGAGHDGSAEELAPLRPPP